MTKPSDIIILALSILLILFIVTSLPKGTTDEVRKLRENTAISYCVDNGGTAQFAYTQGADHFTLTGCTFSKMQERP